VLQAPTFNITITRFLKNAFLAFLFQDIYIRFSLDSTNCGREKGSNECCIAIDRCILQEYYDKQQTVRTIAGRASKLSRELLSTSPPINYSLIRSYMV
jgi:hypothetical protein